MKSLLLSHFLVIIIFTSNCQHYQLPFGSFYQSTAMFQLILVGSPVTITRSEYPFCYCSFVHLVQLFPFIAILFTTSFLSHTIKLCEHKHACWMCTLYMVYKNKNNCPLTLSFHCFSFIPSHHRPISPLLLDEFLPLQNMYVEQPHRTNLFIWNVKLRSITSGLILRSISPQ